MINSAWIKFLRHYGPVPSGDNMFDETLQRLSRRLQIPQIEFEHPYQAPVLHCFDQTTADPVSVILTGTAGDGKTHLCRQAWCALRGQDEDWASDSPYLSIKFHYPKDRKFWPESHDDPNLYREVTIHFIRDLSGWAPQQGAEWEPEKEQLLQKFCHSLFNLDVGEIFLIAANDGQLIESFRRLNETEDVRHTREIFEDLLVEDRHEQPGVRL